MKIRMEHFKLSSSNCPGQCLKFSDKYLQHVDDVFILDLFLDLVGEVVERLQYQRMRFFWFQGHKHGQKLEYGVLDLRRSGIAFSLSIHKTEVSYRTRRSC